MRSGSLTTMPGTFTTPALSATFAEQLSELAVPWKATAPGEPSLAFMNDDLAETLGLDAAALASESGLRFLLGHALPAGAQPVAQVYAGHQFGVFSPRLGDGRALLLGELAAPDGTVRDLHLKGSGPTPFSRGGDGYAPLGAMLKEAVFGEAMHALGIPTTRALAVINTGRYVARDEMHPGAVLMRVASSHLRVGSFQYAVSAGDESLLRRLVNFAVARHAPEQASAPDRARRLLEAVVTAQAELVASWMLIGFVHGVLNTDNVMISGETIDYGPCAFLDTYDPNTTFSSIDHGGRYAYGRQPAITQWNLTRFAEALLPLLGADRDTATTVALEALAQFTPAFDAAWLRGMRRKLGLVGSGTDTEITDFASGFLADLAASRADYTRGFRALGQAAAGDPSAFFEALGSDTPGRWFADWLAREPNPHVMAQANPAVIPRNHVTRDALEAAEAGDLAPVHALIEAVRDPFQDREADDFFTRPGPRGPFRTTCGT